MFHHLKKIFQFLACRYNQLSIRRKLLLTIAFGALGGTGLSLVYVSELWSYLDTKPETCVKCHIMTPEFATWNHSSHREKAICIDCHLPHDNIVVKYIAKGREGMRDMLFFNLHTEKNVNYASRETQQAVMHNCVRCHDHLNAAVKPWGESAGGGAVHHFDRLCWECHREVPHGRIKGLASTPGAHIEIKNSVLPEWIRTQSPAENR